jgi:hypothetical protein
MMKYFLLLLLVFIIHEVAHPQQFYIGVEGGFNQGNFVTYSSNSENIGYSGGAVLQCNFHDMVALRSVLMYRQKRICANIGLLKPNDILPSGEIAIDKFDYNFIFDYITVPVYLQFCFDNKTHIVDMYVGPYVSFLINKSMISKNKNEQIHYKMPINNRFSGGLSAGIGLRIPLHYGLYLSGEGRICLARLDKTNNREYAVQTLSLLVGFGYEL